MQQVIKVISLPCRAVSLALGLLCSIVSYSQSSDYFLKTSDDEMAIELSQGRLNVNIKLSFSAASKYDYLIIERSDGSQSGFSQCKYLKFENNTPDSVVISKTDEYPVTMARDVFYRVRTFTKEGASRIYPSVRLPGIRSENKHP